MTTAKLKRRFGRPARDFALGFTVFAASSVSCATDWMQQTGLLSGSAHARRFEEEAVPLAGLVENQVAAQISTQGFEVMSAVPAPMLGNLAHMPMFLSLALAFAAVFALNLWFARHVQRVHASYRRQYK